MGTWSTSPDQLPGIDDGRAFCLGSCHNHAEMDRSGGAHSIAGARLRAPAVPHRRPVWAALLATTVISLVASGCSVLGLGATYPPASDIKPLPKGAVDIFNVTFPPQGSDNDGDRVVGIGLPNGTTAAMGWADVLRTLESKGWGSGTFRPDIGVCADRGKGDPCADVISPSELAESYTLSDEPSQVRSLLVKLHRYPGQSVMVWFGYT